ncbi:MAG TPA: hypothetical protein VNT81_12080 [Vicinamibacterales bacterium]|nr:hypothetical protein [Vicinamibacterales bacterium]
MTRIARPDDAARPGGLLVVFFIALFLPALSQAQAAAPASSAAPQLSVAEIKDFLKNAKVVRQRGTPKGVTAPKRLTLSNGRFEHDAVFQAIDERKTVMEMGGGGRKRKTELNFVDSYKYNIAAYELATVLGLESMMPVYVERRWNGQLGSISWFVPTLMDEAERVKKNITPPRPADWNNQTYRMRVFSALVRDSDRNQTNILLTPDWKLMMIDFSRAFRLQADLLNVKELHKIDRALLARLEGMTRDDVKTAVQGFLNNQEIDAVMNRRALLVAHFKKLIADLGEARVLY